jgi:uncharacterized protein YaaR (DUF327 family)
MAQSHKKRHTYLDNLNKTAMKYWIKDLKKEDKETLLEIAQRVNETAGVGMFPVNFPINLFDDALVAYWNRADLGCICVVRLLCERALKERIKDEIIIQNDMRCAKYVEKRMNEIGDRGESKNKITRLGLAVEYCESYKDKISKEKTYRKRFEKHFAADTPHDTFGKVIGASKNFRFMTEKAEKLAEKINKVGNKYIHSKFYKWLPKKRMKERFLAEKRGEHSHLSDGDFELNWELFGLRKHVDKKMRKEAKELLSDAAEFIRILSFSYGYY